MSLLPPLPALRPDQHATAEVEVRYEDVAQDGRVKIDALPHALGATCWRDLLMDHPLMAVRHDGILPILSRLVVEGTDAAVGVRHPLEVEGGFLLAHTVDDRGNVDRLLLTMVADIHGRRGRMYGPPPEGEGERALVGRALAEHVFTRPFGPAAERKVLRLAVEGVPPVPPTRADWAPPESLLRAPAGARPLDSEPRPDAMPLVVGLTHTDSNQHVNSLVYPRAFEEAALRRLHEHGRRGALLARSAELAYRKPAFAGDELVISLMAHEDGGGYVVCGSFAAPGADRPHCTVRMRLA